MKIGSPLLILFPVMVCLYIACDQKRKVRNDPSAIKIAGAMRNVMMKGELDATINLDTISPKLHLFGLGPSEYLKGEILIMDGVSFESTISPDSSIHTLRTFKLKAPFFVYANVDSWKEYKLPDSVQTVGQIDTFLKNHSKTKTPFVFRLEGLVESAQVHVVNLPLGFQVKTPSDAKIGQVDYTISIGQRVKIIGFFSTEHKGIFTHHDSNVHMYLITDDESVMGHLDAVKLLPGKTELYLSN